MSVLDDEIERRRQEVRALAGPARARPLHDLARALADRSWRTGTGRPEAAADLDEAIGALDEAYGYFQPGDVLRGVLAGQHGWLLATRHLAHGGPAADRDLAVLRLTEARDCPRLPAALVPVTWLMLGQLHLSRGLGGPSGGGLRMAIRPGAGGAAAREAAECLRRAKAESGASPQLAAFADAMLTVAEAAGAIGQFDMGKLIAAMQKLQRLQKEGIPGLGSPFEGSRIAGLDPMERPVVVIDGPEPEPAAPPRPAAPRPRPVPVPVDTGALRLALREQLGGDPLPALGRLLARDEGGTARAALTAPAALTVLTALTAPAAPAALVDELAALATAIVHAGSPAPADHLVLAAALYLRGRAEGDSADIAAAAESLRHAAVTDEAFPVLLRLSLALRAGGVFGTLSSAVRAAGADALGCPQEDGVLLLHAATGQVSRTTERALPRRVLLVGDRAPAAGIALVSTVAGPAQVVALAALRRRPVTEDAVIVAGIEAAALRRDSYPRAAVLGTAGDVLGRLDASMLHLGCPIGPSGELELAGGSPLTAESIAAAAPARPGRGLVILPPGGYPALADAFLAAGFRAALCWLREVPPPVATAVHLALHARLAGGGQDPASALHSVRRWLRDRERPMPPHLPAGCEAAAKDANLGEYASALIHRGL